MPGERRHERLRALHRCTLTGLAVIELFGDNTVSGLVTLTGLVLDDATTTDATSTDANDKELA